MQLKLYGFLILSCYNFNYFFKLSFLKIIVDISFSVARHVTWFHLMLRGQSPRVDVIGIVLYHSHYKGFKKVSFLCVKTLVKTPKKLNLKIIVRYNNRYVCYIYVIYVYVICIVLYLQDGRKVTLLYILVKNVKRHTRATYIFKMKQATRWQRRPPLPCGARCTGEKFELHLVVPRAQCFISAQRYEDLWLAK